MTFWWILGKFEADDDFENFWNFEIMTFWWILGNFEARHFDAILSCEFWRILGNFEAMTF